MRSFGIIALLFMIGGCAVLQPQAGVKAPYAGVKSPDLKVGERWTYNVVDGFNHLLKGTWVREVTAADGARIKVRLRSTDGSKQSSAVYDGPWNAISQSFPVGGEVTYSPPLLAFPFPLEPGKTWRQKVVLTDIVTGRTVTQRVTGKVVGWDKVKVPAGEFDAIKVIRYVNLGNGDWWRSETLRTEYDWYAPRVKWVVKHEDAAEYYDRTASLCDPILEGDRNIWELVSYTANSAL